MTYLESYWELEGILADLGFSARVIFFHHFLSKNISSEKSYRGSKYFSFELRCRKKYNFLLRYRFFNQIPYGKLTQSSEATHLCTGTARRRMFPSLFFSNSLRNVPALASHCKTFFDYIRYGQSNSRIPNRNSNPN